MIKKDYDNRLFDTDIAPTYGEFVRKIGGYREYYKWAFNNPLPKQQVEMSYVIAVAERNIRNVACNNLF